jgi:hypothetical protein
MPTVEKKAKKQKQKKKKKRASRTSAGTMHTICASIMHLLGFGIIFSVTVVSSYIFCLSFPALVPGYLLSVSIARLIPRRERGRVSPKLLAEIRMVQVRRDEA